ncbi:MAG: dynamin family protein [Planctomycetes bacterium]|nr:dynamin family protein [Planctomycetota bacterium]MCW8134385.1 dynamin family protein [Planctomycetota bacterium]
MNAGEQQDLNQRLQAKIAEGLGEERELLKKLRDLLIRQQFEDSQIDQVSGLVLHLEELFLLVIVGEVKAGKSSFINSLLNAEVCKVGAIPTTDKIHVLKYGDIERERILEEFLIEKQLPFEALRNINIVDTPGTNSIVKRHGEITESFIPRCDLILFTTSVDRPFSETEREFLSYIIQSWAKKIIFIITKKDIKEPHELDEIHKFVQDSARKFFDFEPKIFMVSAKEARKAKHDKDDALYEKSGFKALEDYLFTQLSQGEKLQLKLESPINSAIAIAERATDAFGERMAHLKDDKKVLENIRGQLEQSETDMSENFGRFILEVDNIVYEMEKRGRNWVDDNVKLTNMGMLRSAERFRARFKEEVIKDYEIKIDETLNKAVDWFMKKYLKVWQDTTEYFAEQASRRPHEGMVGKVGNKFEYNREKIYDLVRADSKDRIKGFDYEDQVRKFIGRAGTGINAAIGGSLIGVGAGVAVVALTTAAGFTWIDVTGILGGLTILGGSMVVLPLQRRKIKAEFSDRCTALRAALTEVLDAQIKKEAREAVEKIRESFGPFFDYVARTTGTVEDAIAQVKQIKEGLHQLKRKFGMTLEEEKDALKASDTREMKAPPTAPQPVVAEDPPAPEHAAEDAAKDAADAEDTPEA